MKDKVTLTARHYDGGAISQVIIELTGHVLPPTRDGACWPCLY
jgi:hypothetical protein